MSVLGHYQPFHRTFRLCPLQRSTRFREERRITLTTFAILATILQTFSCSSTVTIWQA